MISERDRLEEEARAKKINVEEKKERWQTKYQNITIQKYKNTKIQKYKKYKNTKIQKIQKNTKKYKKYVRAKCNGAWVTRPERPKGAKDEVKEARRAKRRPEGPQTRSWGPEVPLNF